MEGFDTPLSMEEQQAYAAWAKAGGRDPEKEKLDYDLQGYFKSGGKLGEEHLTDTYKKPNHPTFSTDSMYHGKEGAAGGVWEEAPNKTFKFTPGRSNLDHWGPQGLQDYFSTYEKGNQLVLPAETE